MSEIENTPDSVSSVLKVFAILQALGEEKVIGVTELSLRIMMSKSTVYRFLQTMKTLGYVSQEGETDKYSLNLKLFELGAKALENQDLIKLADEQMYRLGKLTKETLHLGTLDEDSIVYLHKIDSEYNLQMYSRIGRRRPLYSTGLGKIMLAWLPETEIRAILANVTFEPFTKYTLKDIDALLVELEQVRKQGYAEDKEEMEHGLRCFAVPIYSRMGRIIAGLSLSLPLIRFQEESKVALIARLHEAAANISAGLGFHDYPFSYTDTNVLAENI
ncbi:MULTISPECIES: DNA-binding transcriptional regulator KdgR [Proteus]|uniref:DNA-binding transcriptional regulator KdgR n=1 Tax=Proteus TaxID=583 RepID=UPI000BFCA5D2|nr:MULTISPECIES: DNA-binding transcriptional regulator KdgR [Proteus]ATM99042.1 DNA-binding transcriptional regulator KdgR [Proteus vulgaris]MBG2836688.1 DNA-binding transcriptional regulator KdgR [Proteus terrae subsp. cibarius]MBG2868221.1 DNA-binding transcriptional regulator KdgR [Proteus terrae subsp. cibarius]MBJ2108676.1 DNA-binding transcriptional regulator KdgR [Proteus terrae]MBJ2132620.1 DNA-binding transcriptional regulator KdgR [Proteus terrae]